MADVIGSTSKMPGNRHDLPDGQMCDIHPNVKAVARIQGETDSMGAELNDMCQQCLDQHKQYMEEEKNTKEKCDWCHSISTGLRNRRDYNEGMAGPVYRVCVPCVKKQNDAAREELEEYDSELGFCIYED